jgi:hypothetical protein
MCHVDASKPLSYTLPADILPTVLATTGHNSNIRRLAQWMRWKVKWVGMSSTH